MLYSIQSHGEVYGIWRAHDDCDFLPVELELLLREQAETEKVINSVKLVPLHTESGIEDRMVIDTNMSIFAEESVIAAVHDAIHYLSTRKPT